MDLLANPGFLAIVGVALFFLASKVDSFALSGLAVGCLFWSGVLYSIT